MGSSAMASAGPAALRIEGVNVSYGHNHVLKDVDLRIEPGEFFAFLGPSGCGKTTLLRLIAGFNEATSGRVLVDGRDLSALPPWKRHVGMVFQSYALWPHMSVAQNVAFGLEERRVPRAEIRRRVAAVLDLVGLGALAGRHPAQLSGGQQQRVALARTLAIEPRILLLDEPLSNLDAQMRVQVRRELRDLQQRLGLTTIFVTHDQEEANTVCDRIAVMRDGAVQQVGTPVSLYENPANLFVARFLGTTNVIEGAMAVGGFRLADGRTIPAPAGIPAAAHLVIRPQDVEFGVAPDGIALDGHVRQREFLGASVRYGVDTACGEILVDVPFRAGQALRATGEAVALGLPMRALKWLPG